jgi:broad specificity phosphatase PhoE
VGSLGRSLVRQRSVAAEATGCADRGEGGSSRERRRQPEVPSRVPVSGGSASPIARGAARPPRGTVASPRPAVAGGPEPSGEGSVEIVLVRHGEPAWEPGGVAVDEPELTPYGHAQARRAAIWLAREAFDALYVSPLRRARETAVPIARAVGLEPIEASWLRELGLPPLAGKTAEEVQRFFAETRARDLTRWWDGMPGGESFRHFHERVSAGIEALLTGDEHRLELHEDGGHRLWRLPQEERRILIVAHEGTNALIVSHLLGIEPTPWEWMRFSSSWAGISRLRTAPVAGGAVWVLRRFNETTHLEALADGRAGSGAL